MGCLVRRRGLAALSLAALGLALAGLFVFLSDSQPAQAQAGDHPGVIWHAEITPAASGASGVTGWSAVSGSAYGSINGAATFTDGGATYTVERLAHRDGTGISDSTAMLLRMTVSPASEFTVATLCAGGLAVPIPSRSSAGVHEFVITGNGVTAAPPWTTGSPVTVGIVRWPAACDTLAPQTGNPPGVLWKVKITPADDPNSHNTGWERDRYGSIEGGQAFTDNGATFTVQRVMYRPGGHMRIRMFRPPTAAFAEATLCVGDQAVTLPAKAGTNQYNELGREPIPPWTLGTPVTVGLVRAPATCDSLGIVWHAEITPAAHTVTGVTGWQAGTYGSIDGGQTFIEGGASFTVKRVSHNSGTRSVWFRLERSSSAAFGAATLCVGHQPVPIAQQAAGTGAIDLAITTSGVTATPPWTLGTPLRVGIVRAPATCAQIAPPPPTTGVLWQASLIPGVHPELGNAHLTGWSSADTGAAYGTLSNNHRTFTDAGATFTLLWLTHNSNVPELGLWMTRSSSVEFAAATLCVGGLAIPIPQQAAGISSIDIGLTDPAITSTASWTVGTPVTVGIIRAPATCADVTPPPATGILWQAQITPGESSTIPGITGWVQDAYGSINGGQPFLDRGAMFNVQWVSHRGIRSQMRLGLQRSAAAAFDEATLCAGGRSIPIPAQEEGDTQISLEITDPAIGGAPPWTLGTALTVGIVRAPATCSDLAPPGGILWQAEITPAIHSSASFAHITGWSSVGAPYGSINGGRTFTENGATFTVRWVAHNSNTPAMLLRMQRSASVAFDTATLCVGGLSVQINPQSAGTDDINLTIADTVVTGTPPWTLGTPLTVGIVRAPTPCAELAQAPPPAAGALSARIISRLEDDGRLYFETGTTVTVRATVTAPANTPYRWAALTRQEEPQQELTLSGATSGSFASRVTGRTLSVMLHAPEAGPDFYNLYLLRLTVGDLVVDTKVVVTRAEPEGRAALVFADAGADRTVTVGTRVTLQGRAGPEGASLSTYWKQVGGRLLGTDQGFTPEFSGDFLLFNQGGLRPNFIAPNRPDRIVLRLDVEDEYRNRASDTVTITVVEEQVPDTTPPKPTPTPEPPPDEPEQPVVDPPTPPPPPPPPPKPRGPAWFCNDGPYPDADPFFQKVYRDLCE